MKNNFIRLGLALMLPLLMAACIGTTPTPPTNEAKPKIIEVTEEAKLAETEVTKEPQITGPRIGDSAPDFTLPDSNGNMVHLAEELKDNRMVILVFYHAFG